MLVFDIDESSLSTIAAWPWGRERIADMVEILLTDYRSRGIALDIVLPEASDAMGDTRLALLAQHAPLVLAQVLDYIMVVVNRSIEKVRAGGVQRSMREIAAAALQDALTVFAES